MPVNALPDAGAPSLRRAVLMVSVLHDLDVLAGPDAVLLSGEPSVAVPWEECWLAVEGVEADSADGVDRLHRWLRARRLAADLGSLSLAAQLRPVGLPVDHVLHPGRGWVCEHVLGEALDLGLGAVGLDPADPDSVVLLPTSAVTAAGIDLGAAWERARERLEEIGTVASALLLRDAKGLLRPVGDVDVVTLLGARTLRVALTAAQGGMAAAVVPMRRRGWTRLSLVDPAFGPAAAAATAPTERGFTRPVLLTADEVTVVALRIDLTGARPDVLALRQPAAADPPWGREVLRR